MNSRERCKLRRKLRRAAERAEATKDIRLCERVSAALVGSHRVAKALALCEHKSTEAYSGSTCLPGVSLYAAGYRKSENITTR